MRDLLLLILVELVRNWPDPSVALEHLEFEFRVQDENCHLTLVLSLGLGSSANDEVRAALVLLYSQRDNHVLHSHGLDVLERPPHACLLQLMNLKFLGDQPEDSNIVRLEVLHAHRVSLLLVLLLTRFVGVLLVLGHFCEYLLDSPFPVSLFLLTTLDKELSFDFLLFVIIFNSQT